MDTYVFIVILLVFGILVVGAVYLTLNRLLLSYERRGNVELMKNSKSLTVPMRLQAYERLVLFLERISPDMLLLKLKNQAQTNADLHLAILRNIRFEYEHNISQQLYVSNEIWTMVKQAKEQIAMSINDLAKQTDPANSSIELANKIINKFIEDGELPVADVIAQIKSEAAKIM